MLFGIVGCAPKQIQLADSYQNTRRTGAATSQPRHACNLSLGEVKDLRPDQAGLGQLNIVTDVQAGDLSSWLHSALTTLETKQPVAPGAFPLTLDAELLKAYVNFQATSLAATTVVRTRLHRGANDVIEKVYRGNDSAVNWAYTESEVQKSLNRSLQQVVDTLQADIVATCATLK